MPTSVISGDDIRFLVQQSPAQLTTIMGQMTTLVQGITNLQNDTNSRVEAMEKQGWFKRMVLTVSGKNKATKAEIQKNQDKVVSYVSQAVAQCYQMNCIDQQVICSLGNRMNQIYAQVNEAYNEQLQMKAQIAEIQLIQQQTLQSLGNFVTALNEKIESIDNFHMLIEEIRLGRYNDESKLYSLCCILSQLDKRTLEDDRKLDIMRGELVKRGIVSEDGISVSAYLDEILSLPEDKVGTVYLELCNFRENFPANLFAEMIEAYHFLPKMEKMSKKKETIVQRVLERYELDDTAEFSYIDISESFIESKQNSLVDISTLQIGMNDNVSEVVTEVADENVAPVVSNQYSNDPELKRAEELYLNGQFKEAFDKFEELANAGNGRAMYFLGEYYAHGELGIDKDADKGDYWRRKGAEAGDPLAKLNTAYLYDHESNEFSAIIDEILPTIQKMADSGDVIAMNELSDLYISSKYEDPNKAIELLEKCAEKGYFHSEFKLGLFYYLGVYVSKNGKKGLNFLKRAAAKNFTAAEAHIGLYYKNENNYDEASRWFYKAAEKGNALALLHMGEFCLYGYGGIKTNEERAIEYFTKSLDKGMIEAATFLGNIYREKKKYNLAYEYLKKAADAEDAEAQNALGLMYDNGEGVAEHKEKAAFWFHKAADQGYSPAQYNLGLCFYYGDGVEINKIKSKNYLKQAADQGHERAIEFLKENF